MLEHLLWKINRIYQTKILGNSVNEMSLVGCMDEKSGSYKQKVWVHDEPDFKSPHFHVLFDVNNEYVLTIKDFKILHEPRNNPMNNKMMKQLKFWMNEKSIDTPIRTNFEETIILWNREHPDKRI